MSTTLQEAFAKLARFWPDFETRPAQLLMADRVHHTLREGGRLAVEAPTGVGKSMAYLVPAVLAAAEEGRRIVISTQTKNLQAQIVTRDAPRVRDVLAPEIKLAVLKGRSNYLCARRWQRLVQQELLPGVRAAFVDRLGAWAERTITGDLDELGARDVEEASWLRELAAPEAHEEGVSCHRSERCFLRESRRRAAASSIVIVNHSLLLTHHLTPAQVLPEYDVLIIDEAHTLAAAAARALERRASPETLRAALVRVTGPDQRLLEDVRRLWERDAGAAHAKSVRTSMTELAGALARVRRVGDGTFRALARQLGRSERRYGRRDAERDLFPAEMDDLIETLGDACAWLGRVREGLAALTLTAEADEETAQRFLAGMGAIEGFLACVRFTVEVPDAGFVYWYEGHPQPALVAVPLHPGEAVARSCLLGAGRLVLTSATLAANERFDHFLGEVGLSSDSVETLATDTPFPLDRQVAAIAPPMPPPDHPAFVEETVVLLARLAQRVGRKALALFTSYDQLRLVREGLLRADLDAGIVVLAQGVDGSREHVTETFRRAPRAILLGTASFWEGVDFPGTELEVLVMARLPFPVPSQPIVEARCEEIEAGGGSSFAQLMIPEAVLRFRQGFGRLIRRSTDRGVFVILDPRIRSAGYRAKFERSLPVPVMATRDLDAAVDAAAAWFCPAETTYPSDFAQPS